MNSPGITKTIATLVEYDKKEDDELELVTFGSQSSLYEIGGKGL
jgi:hypothetical protein